MNARKLAMWVVGASMTLVATHVAIAQDQFPVKPIRLLLGFPAGGSSDRVARLLASPLAERLGVSVVVENRAGAGGNIAADIVAKSKADGYTLLFVPSGHATNAAMKKGLPFDPVLDFTWISTVAVYPLALSVRPDSRITSFPDFVQRVRQEPGKYTYTSVGIGTGMHLFGEWLMHESGGNALHVPFQGGAASLTELLAGRVDVMIDTMTGSAPLARERRIRLLATTAPKSEASPGMATVADTYPGLVYESWLGFAAPAGTPKAIVDRLNREIRAVVASQAVEAQIADMGAKPEAGSSDEFRMRVAKDISQFSKIVADRKIEQQ